MALNNTQTKKNIYIYLSLSATLPLNKTQHTLTLNNTNNTQQHSLSTTHTHSHRYANTSYISNTHSQQYTTYTVNTRVLEIRLVEAQLVATGLLVLRNEVVNEHRLVLARLRARLHVLGVVI